MRKFIIKIFCLAFYIAAIIVVSSCVDKQMTVESSELLCDDIAESRYNNIAQMERAALQLDTLAATTQELRAVAKNALAYAALMRMDYSAAKKQYLQVVDEAQCEVERLVADVGLMTVSYRVSANKDFFDYRSSAIRRVRRINEEIDVLLPHDKKRFAEAKIELAAVSLCYFANLGMNDDAKRAASYLEKNIDEAESPQLRLYGRMVLNYRVELPLSERAESLLKLHRRLQSSEQQWLMANCKLMLAVLMRDNASREKIFAAFPSYINELSQDALSAEFLPYNLSIAARDGFLSYGDEYMAIEAISVAASCATQMGHYEKALEHLDSALGHINAYYECYYPANGFLPLQLGEVDEQDEELRMECDTIENIYECMLSVRREASCAYAGVGDKYASDVNRNVYLDLLRSTRLNKQTESRIAAARESAANLYMWLVVTLLLVLISVVAIFIMNKRWKQRNMLYATDLNRLLKVCRMLMSALPQALSDANAVCSAVCDILNGELHNFSGVTRFSIVASDSAVEGCATCVPLVLMDGSSQWVLCIETQIALTNVKKSLLSILVPYIAVAIDEGMRIVDIGDERTRLQQKQESYSIYLAEHKRENVIKRVSLSVVNGMTPYINRIQNELSRLSLSVAPKDGDIKRLDYISELLAVLDDYNTVLEQWIKMKHGELNLHIESFALSELFAILKNRTQGFLLKGVNFCIKDTAAVVKADKALTLFMINTLADNAGKFTPRGGSVTLEAIETEDYIEIAVADTGCGMNNDDVDKILNNKVYDASCIGCDAPLSSNKGGGFGLMNCKGIIEKYRKSDALFSVCRLDIASEVGRGSRFSFRLPKGIMRIIIVLLIMLPSFAGALSLDNVGALADSVYSCNVDGRHRDALRYAQEALNMFNEFYREAYPEESDTIAFSEGSGAELRWWRSSLFADSITEDIYYNLLDIRNEVAVAALALQNWQLYRYNNNIYTSLYRLVHEDKEIVQHYEQLQSIANYRYAVVVVCVALLVVLLVVAVIMYMRRVLLEKMNTLMLFEVNSRLLKVARMGRMKENSFAENIAQEIFEGTHEYLRASCVVVLLKNGSTTQFAASPTKVDRRTEIFLAGIMEGDGAYVSRDGRVRVLPLVAKTSNKEKAVGVLYLEFDRMLTASETAILELIASYAASTIYYSFVCLAENYRSLDYDEEEAVRLKYEENYIHVRNMVIDNCLSMIKHETIYYPPRLGALVEKLRAEKVSASEWNDKVTAIKELITYYNQIFTLLSNCASRQLDDTSFSVTQISLNAVCENMQRYVARKAKRCGVNVALCCDVDNAVAYADKVLVEFLFSSLIDAMMVRKMDGTISITAVEDGNMLRVEVVDSRYHLTTDELSAMFVPNSSGATSLEYLIVKEIVRMHEDYMDIRGGRVEAYDSERGTTVLFTLPRLR